MRPIYDDIDKLREILKEKAALSLHEGTKDLANDSYLKYVRVREYTLFCEHLKAFDIVQLRERTKYYNAPFPKKEFEGYEEIMEIVTQGTLEESFVFRQTEKHRRECETYEYLYVPICVIPDNAIKLDDEHYMLILSDPYGDINATIPKELFNRSLLKTPCLAEIGFTSMPRTPHTIRRIRTLDELNEKRNLRKARTTEPPFTRAGRK